jgi:class 3 adenylate cyclase
MATTTATRRLAAILAADVAGYSRLTGADEEGTHERLKAHLGELIDPKIREYHGRVVKTTGDGVLAEFASVVMRCAVRLKSSVRWPTAIWISPRSAACAFASGSISAT